MQVEDTLFNIPRYGLTIDHAFDALFSVTDTDELAGSSDEHPIHLENVTAEQFRSLLKVLFPPYVRYLTRKSGIAPHNLHQAREIFLLARSEA